MRKVAMIDVDGVLLDYNKQYAKGWYKSFNETLEVVDLDAYWAKDVYNARELNQEEIVKWRAGQDADHWATMEPMDGAIDLLKRLKEADYLNIACSKLEPIWHKCRQENLNKEFPGLIDALICTGDIGKHVFVNGLEAEIFIDDFANYFYNVKSSVKRVLFNRSRFCPNNPNKLIDPTEYYQIVTSLDQIKV